jgi:hypothetical protein
MENQEVNEQVITITQSQAAQISAILNELPIRELGKVQAIIQIFNQNQEDSSEDQLEESDD